MQNGSPQRAEIGTSVSFKKVVCGVSTGPMQRRALTPENIDRDPIARELAEKQVEPNTFPEINGQTIYVMAINPLQTTI